jgi:hypothetical protein
MVVGDGVERERVSNVNICEMSIGARGQTATSTQPSINRGAARQMYGSGSLRQTGSLPNLGSTTDLPLRRGKGKEEPKNALGRKEDHAGKSYEHEIDKSRGTLTLIKLPPLAFERRKGWLFIGTKGSKVREINVEPF